MDTLAVAVALVSDAWVAVEHLQSWGSACKCTRNAGNSKFWGTRRPAVVVTLVPRHGHRQSSHGAVVWSACAQKAATEAESEIGVNVQQP